MSGFAWFFLILLAVIVLYLWLIMPRKHHPDAQAFTGKLYAHRGLHDGNHAVPENSLAAFGRAVDAGYGIELDVQLTADKVLIVHHDGNTRRVCGVDAEIRNVAYAALPLLPDGTPIPTFQQVLEKVGGKVPLIVEVKPYGSAAAVAAATREALSTYPGPYCVESFHPLAVQYFRRHAPEVLRGQLAMGGPYRKESLGPVSFFMLKNLMVDVLGRPDFIAYSCAEDKTLSMWLMKRLYHPLLAAWTVRTQNMLDVVRRDYDMPIFELFIPDENQAKA